MRKKKTGTKKRTRTGKRTSGAGSKAPDNNVSSFLAVGFTTFFETYLNHAFFRRR
jgi:hypothetical protein